MGYVSPGFCCIVGTGSGFTLSPLSWMCLGRFFVATASEGSTGLPNAAHAEINEKWKVENEKIRRLSRVVSDFNVFKGCYRNPYLQSLHSFPPLQHLKNFFPAQAEKLLDPKKRGNLLFKPEIHSCEYHQLLFEKFDQHLL